MCVNFSLDFVLSNCLRGLEFFSLLQVKFRIKRSAYISKVHKGNKDPVNNCHDSSSHGEIHWVFFSFELQNLEQ